MVYIQQVSKTFSLFWLFGMNNGLNYITPFLGSSFNAESACRKDEVWMDVRIEKRRDGDCTVIQVAGELKGQGVVELERLCRETTGRLSLDLSNLRSSGPGGVQLIRELAAQGVEISGITPYMGLLLDA